MLSGLLKHALWAAIVPFVFACSASSEPISEQRSAVLGGKATGAAHGAVVYVAAEIRVFNGNPVFKIGSGTLVAPNLVATALHVVSTNPSDVPFTCDSYGNEVSGHNGSLLGPPVAPEKIEIYAGPSPGPNAIAHGSQIVSSGSPTICQNDIAFVVLDQAVDLPTVQIRRGAPLELGTPLTVVGFGNEDMDSGPLRRNARDVSVSAVGEWIRTFTVTEGPCLGDSGGPALTEAGELAGIFSTVAVDCAGSDAAPKYTDVSYFSSLVEQAFDTANAGSPWQGGDAGTASQQDAGSSGSGGASGKGDGCAFQRGEKSPSSVPIACALLALALLVRARAQR